MVSFLVRGIHVGLVQQVGMVGTHGVLDSWPESDLRWNHVDIVLCLDHRFELVGIADPVEWVEWELAVEHMGLEPGIEEQ